MIQEKSRYLKTAPFVDSNNKMIFCVRDFHKFSLKNASYYRVKSSDTLENIAYRFLYDCRLGWAILDCNPKYLNELEIKTGDIITIPAFSEVVKVL